MKKHGNVVVTGASGGIGREIAVALGAGGWHVLLASRNLEQLEQTADLVRDAHGTADAFVLDVADESSIDRFAADLRSRGIGVHSLVNNSGIPGPSKPLWEVEPSEWDDTMDVNLRGLYLCCRAFMPQMIERGAGSVVNVGSTAGKNPLVHRAPYSASKSALIGLTKTLAADAGPSGVRVNLVSPGAVGGERLDWVAAARAKALGVPESEVRAAAAKDAALKRFTEASEVANTVRFLVSDESSGITGIDITVAAGYAMN